MGGDTCTSICLSCCPLILLTGMQDKLNEKKLCNVILCALTFVKNFTYAASDPYKLTLARLFHSPQFLVI